MVVVWVWIAAAFAEPKVPEPVAARSPIETVGDAIEEKKSKEELERQERLRKIDEAQGDQAARVIVLRWPDAPDTDHHNQSLVRNIRSRIARPNAKFFPEIDLYQAGRKEPDRTVLPIDQRASPPESAMEEVARVTDEVATIPWRALTADEWGVKAHELRTLAQRVWFVDRVEAREPLFLLYAQIGRAADNAGTETPPFYAYIGGRTVPYYWYLAGVLAHETPDLLSQLSDQDLHGSVSYWKNELDRKALPSMTLGFDLNGVWDAKAFAGEYQLFVNGVEQLLKDDKGLYAASPGIADVFLRTSDGGYGLSERIELEKLDEKIYFVLEVARKRMGIDFIDQLMRDPNRCIPDVDGDIMLYLAIYARLHPGSDIYIVIPKGGSTSPNNLYLWQWDRPTATLVRVLDDTGGFPVRFAALVGAGLTFSSATYTPPSSEELADAAAAASPDDPSGGLTAATNVVQKLPVPVPAGFPLAFHLRGHYNRLMVATGLEFSAALQNGGEWSDLYQTNTHDGASHDVVTTSTETVTVGTGTTATPSVLQIVTPELRVRTWQRLVFFGFGGVIGRDASIGFGPRGWIRTGWTNVPHAVDLTGHLGYTAQAPFSTKSTGRVRPLVDVDGFGGVMIPYRDSLYIKGNDTFPLTAEERDRRLGKVLPTFGFTVGVGLTF